MSKSMFKVYSRDEGKKWLLLAAFVWKTDALAYAYSKMDEGRIHPHVKIMRGNSNYKVF